jgi:hypothetical protein
MKDPLTLDQIKKMVKACGCLAEPASRCRGFACRPVKYLLDYIDNLEAAREQPPVDMKPCVKG